MSIIDNSFKIVKIDEVERIFQIHLRSLDLLLLKHDSGYIRFEREVEDIGEVEIIVRRKSEN